MEENMYTYHYYKRRSITRRTRTPGYLMSTIIVFGAAYTITSLLYLLH